MQPTTHDVSTLEGIVGLLVVFAAVVASFITNRNNIKQLGKDNDKLEGRIETIRKEQFQKDRDQDSVIAKLNDNQHQLELQMQGIDAKLEHIVNMLEERERNRVK